MEQKERTRTSISPTGLNKSTPDNVVEDGALEVCHNLRFANGAWRNVQEFEKKPMPQIDGYDILYKHPATPENMYIGVTKDVIVEKKTSYYAHRAGNDVYYTKKPLDNIASSLGLYTEYLYSRIDFSNAFIPYGIIKEIKGKAITYEPRTTPIVSTFNSAFVTLVQGSISFKKELFFLKNTIAVGDDVYIQEAVGYSAYGVVSRIDDGIYYITIGEEEYHTEKPSLTKRVPMLPYSHKYSDTNTIYLPDPSPSVGALIMETALGGFRATHLLKITNVTTENIEIGNIAHPDGEEIQDNPIFAQYITITAVDADGVQSIYTIPSNLLEYNEVYYTIELLRYENGDIVEESALPNGYVVKEINISSGEVTQTIGTCASYPLISHFGQLIIVTNEEEKDSKYYLYSNGSYSRTEESGYCRSSISIVDSVHSSDVEPVPIPYDAKDDDNDGFIRRYYAYIGMAEKIAAFGGVDCVLESETAEGHIRGEFAYFISLLDKNNVEIYRSVPQIVRTEILPDNKDSYLVYQPALGHSSFEYNYIVWKRTQPGVSFIRVGKDNKTFGDIWHYCVSGEATLAQGVHADAVNKWMDQMKKMDSAGRLYKLRLDIELDSIESGAVEKINVYATRLHPLFVWEEGELRNNPVNVFEEPFYRLDSLDATTRSIELTATSFRNIEQRPQYMVTQRADSLYAHKRVEYNSALHLYDVEMLAPRIVEDTFLYEEGSSAEDCAIEYEYDSRKISQVVEPNTPFADIQGYSLVLPRRVSKMAFGTKGNASIVSDSVFTPRYVAAMDISYVVDIIEDKDAKVLKGSNELYKKSNITKELEEATREVNKYQPIRLHTEEEKTIALGESFPVHQPNRLQVSADNNPFILPYERSYRIGSSINRIITANSAAIEMSDAKFGEFPLYVFTTEGIYAMQSGTETLYSAIVPIAKDVAINPNTLAVNGAVLFFTDKGLHSLSRNGVQLLSAGLHKDDNRIPEWMYTCKLAHLPEYNEVMCLLMDGENTTGKAYVFSLDNNCWSERDVPQGQILNNNEVLCVESIHNLVNEGEDVVATIELETRPIKLGASKELKRLETLIVRFEADKDEELEVTIKGSIDGVEYKDLRKVSATTNTDVLIRRTPSSVKYLKFVVKSGSLQSSIRLIRFDTEHYLRFVRRMR